MCLLTCSVELLMRVEPPCLVTLWRGLIDISVLWTFCVVQLKSHSPNFSTTPSPPLSSAGASGKGHTQFRPAFWTLLGSAGMGMCGGRKTLTLANGSRPWENWLSCTHILTNIHNLIMTFTASIWPQSLTWVHMQADHHSPPQTTPYWQVLKLNSWWIKHAGRSRADHELDQAHFPTLCKQGACDSCWGCGQ